MEKYYILAIDSMIQTFSISDEAGCLSFNFSTAQNDSVLESVNEGDLILGYLDSPVCKIKYVFYVEKADDKNEISFKKLLEVNDGISIDDLSLEQKLASDDILQIDKATYSKYYNGLLKSIDGFIADDEKKEVDRKVYNYDTNKNISYGNIIIYGTPGCGKSYFVKNKLLTGYAEENIIRTTFYQDYTNTDFVGQILPSVSGKDVTYKFNPGPFSLALNQAVKNQDKKVALVIEELNRGNAPSIFGDIFQLLDRENGKSEYQITNINIQQYLEKENPEYIFNHIVIPSNLSIIATMNTSDQNVYTLDTAFKRRWDFMKLKNIFETSGENEHPYRNYLVPGANNITWQSFVNSINEFMINTNSDLQSEDKQLGIFFVNKNLLCQNISDVDDKKIYKFAYKVLEYLWDDVAKFERDMWFVNDIRTLDELVDKYIKSGVEVFKDGVFKK